MYLASAESTHQDTVHADMCPQTTAPTLESLYFVSLAGFSRIMFSSIFLVEKMILVFILLSCNEIMFLQ